MKRLTITICILAYLATSLLASADSPLALYSKWKSLSTDSLTNMGRDFDLRNSADSALVCYSIVSDRLHDNASSRTDMEALARVLNNIGYIYATFHFDYPKALNYFQESLRISETIGYDKNAAFVNLNMGGVYLGCNFMYGKRLFSDETWEYLMKAMDSGIATDSYEVALVAFLNMGQLYFEDPQKDNIRNAIIRLKGTDLPHKVPIYPFIRRYADGLEKYINEDYVNARILFNESIELIPSGTMHSSRLEIIALSAVAESQIAMREYAEAISTIENLLAKARKIEASDEETKAYRMLSSLYDKTGNSDRAAAFLFQYMHKKDSTLSERDMTQLSKMPIVNELEQIKFQLEKERLRKRVLILTGSASFLIIVLLVLYLVNLIRNRRKMNAYVKDLYRKNIELIQAENREREISDSGCAATTDTNNHPAKAKYTNSDLTEKEKIRIAQSIRDAMSDTDMITATDFTMEKLAAKIGCQYKYVSQVVNEVFGKNFRALLNEYRIKEACIRLLDTDSYGHFTIETIAETLGFNSRSNFIMTFKKITGLTPSQFQKNAMEDK